jgi:nitroimidazol reductase NimA-like FMN-containing flavoprotein (pyridoxamine 5'-phosphate oxidase superfamily)
MGELEACEGMAEMESILRRETWGCLGLCRDGEPYVVPLNYAYVDGKILFHCALEGLKLDCIRANPNVCFVVARQEATVSDHGGTKCHIDCDSVICTGTARIVDDLEDRAAVLNAFNRAFKPEAEDLAENRVGGCGAVEITVTKITGRRERGGKRTLWECD